MLAVDGDPSYDLQTGVWYAGINTSANKMGTDVDKFNNIIIVKRHDTRFNALFLDCHVEWLQRLPYNSILDGSQ